MKRFKQFLNESDMIMTNSLRNPIHPTEEGVRNFWKWFGNSKAVDDDGRPIVVYHGTNDRFTKINTRKGAQGIFWVTSNKESIASGEAGAQGTKIIMELYVKIESPADWKQYDNLMIDEFRGRGLDGAILPDSNGFVAFVLHPDQIKSVDNNGKFDPASPSIRG
jgi:hypothetical protein